MKYIALLRGINVGGNNKVGMADLRHVVEQAGMKNVSTYINSGNVIFESELDSRFKLAQLLESSIHDRFGFMVKVLVWRADDIVALAKSLPDGWANDTVMKCDVMFLWEDIDDPGIVDTLIIKPDIDRVVYVPGALLWSIDRDKVTKSGMLRLIGTDTYKHMTIRNCTTLRKLASLCG